MADSPPESAPHRPDQSPPETSDNSGDPTGHLTHPAVRRVTARLAALGVPGRVRTLDDSARTAAQAAAQLGVGVAQIANSLVFAADGAPLLVMSSGGHRVDTGKVAALVGASRVDRADPEFVRSHTGFAIGGVAPVGHPEPLRTLVDTHLATYDEVWAAGGHPHTVFPTTFDELVRITGGTAADVA
jgi:prolyl-tRNA editing enzyme YbaK/EbsC (Cys-tRNA(Pro) deacylase)